ncbi:MAG: ABC transporter ATP-binding protein [Rhizobiales bacterium]|nr:ABC transporter ATP-binding protein [Hyphomicrobiales bacterium]
MTTAAPCQLDIAGLSKRYGGVTAVDGVDLTVPAGEVLALLGPSGCGKTTVLQSIAGFVTPDGGDIRLDGASLLPVPPERRRAAMLFQHYALFPHMSVRANVGFGLSMARVPKAEAARRVDEALRLVRIEALAERRPAQLSGGQRQRVALARAVVTEPRLLLLDEPLGALDQNLREAMQVELRKLQQRLGLTTVMVTHDQREAIVLSDRIAVMREGKVEQLGTPLEIHDHPRTRYVASFCGVENLLAVESLGQGAVAVAGGVVQGLRPPGNGAAPVTLAVRAEALTVAARAAGPGEIGGIVTFTQVLGAAIRYEVSAGDAAIVVTEARRDAPPLAPGTAVALALPPGRCTLLAD